MELNVYLHRGNLLLRLRRLFYLSMFLMDYGNSNDHGRDLLIKVVWRASIVCLGAKTSRGCFLLQGKDLFSSNLEFKVKCQLPSTEFVSNGHDVIGELVDLNSADLSSCSAI